LNGAGSLNNRWDSNGNLNSSAQQQTMFEETQKRSAVAAEEDSRPVREDGSYDYAGGTMGKDGWMINPDGSRYDPFNTLTAMNEMGAGNQDLMNPAYKFAVAAHSKQYGLPQPWEID